MSKEMEVLWGGKTLSKICYERMLPVLRDIRRECDRRDFDVVVAAGAGLMRLAIEVGRENEHFANEGPLEELSRLLQAQLERDAESDEQGGVDGG